MADWIDVAPAVLLAWYPGCEGGRALADILWGKANPAGRLPITFTKRTGMLPYTYDIKPTGRSYDYTDARGSLEQFSFGHGLSYTKFTYESLRVAKSAKKGFPLRVSCRIQNTGRRAGDEVVQLYVRDRVASLSRPLKELKGFKRIHLKAGEMARVEFKLTKRDLSFLAHNLKMVFEPGDFDIMIGSSSSDIRLQRKVKMG
jgi:beta-glucosidase